MERTVKTKLTAAEKKQIRAEMRAQIAEMKLMNKRIRKHQAETARLQIKTRAALTGIAEIFKNKPFSDYLLTHVTQLS